MSYCLNPLCSNPRNPQGSQVCLNCGSSLLMKKRYRALQSLGGGAMSRTFLGVDEDRLQTPCILKQFSPQQKNSAQIKKAKELFYQEAMRLQELGNHPQIPHLFACFEAKDRLYLVQEYIEGDNLLEELEFGKPLDEKLLLELLLDLLPVIKFIHDHQVIHRDIKPENIIRRRFDRKLVLVDFGVAKHEVDFLHPKTGTMTGTIGYAPLEQIRGGKAYPASDLYSLGVTCIHLLTGVTPNSLFDPFTGEFIWRSHLKQTHRSISPQLNHILNKLLADLVKDRYQWAEEVLQDLQHPPKSPLQVMVALQIASQQAELTYQSSIWGIPSPEPFTIGQLWRSSFPSLLSIPSLNPTRNLPPQTAEKIWQCKTTLKGHAATVKAIVVSPNGYILVSGSADQTIRLWNLTTGQLLHRFCGHGAAVNTIAISPNGCRFVSGSLDRTLLAWNLNTCTMTDRFFSHSGSPYSHRHGPINGVAYSPDGRIIASCSANPTIKLWNQRNGELLYRLCEHSGEVFCVTFASTEANHSVASEGFSTHPQSSLFASGGGDGQIKIWRFGKLHSLQTLTGHSAGVLSLAFSPNQTLLASASEDGTIKLWDFQKGTLVATLSTATGMMSTVAISPDGKLLAGGSSDGKIRLWKIDNWQPSQEPLFEISGYSPITFGADSHTLVCSNENHELLVWQCGD